MVSFVLKPMIPNLDLLSDLIVVLTFVRKILFIGQSEIFWSTPVR